VYTNAFMRAYDPGHSPSTLYISLGARISTSLNLGEQKHPDPTGLNKQLLLRNLKV
jgi:hypothetical protein